MFTCEKVNIYKVRFHRMAGESQKKKIAPGGSQIVTSHLFVISRRG